MPGASHADLNSARLGQGHVAEHDVERERHHRDVDRKRQHEAGVLAGDELRPADRLRQERVDAAAVDFLRNQPDADENRDEQAEHADRRQPEVLDDLDVLPCGELPEEERRRDQQDREEHQVVGHAIPDGLAEHAERYPASRAHWTSSPGCCARAPSPVSATRRTKKSSSVSRKGFSETSDAPVAIRSASSRSGGGSSASSRAYRPGEISTVRRTRRCNSREHLRPEIGYDQLPAVDLEGEDVGEAA